MNVPERKGQFREGFQPEPAPAVEPSNDAASQPEATPEPAAEPAGLDIPIDAWPVEVKLLRKKIRNNKGDLVDKLTFREPTGGDINRYGNPVRVDGAGEVIIDERKMTLIMSALSGVLLPFIEGMDPRDWNSCAYRLRGFFLPDTAAW